VALVFNILKAQTDCATKMREQIFTYSRYVNCPITTASGMNLQSPYAGIFPLVKLGNDLQIFALWDDQAETFKSKKIK
jgi:hypothetical protein